MKIFNIFLLTFVHKDCRLLPLSMAKIFLFALLLVFLASASGFSQVPTSQTAGGIEQQEKLIEKEKALKKKIEEKKKKPQIEEKEKPRVSPEKVAPQKKVLIKKITVEGSTLISAKEIEKVISPFRNKELTLTDMQKVADLITDLYRKKGYLTSRAYLPPQTIREATLLIRVVEGRRGKVEIKGNRYFKSSLLERKLRLKEGEPFNYSTLQKALTLINEHPDREAKLVLVPGKEPGTTDIVLEVKDRLPIHVSFGYDNYGSRFIDKRRYSVILEHNNFLGFDDKFYLKYQQTRPGLLHLITGRYTFPLSNTLEMGLHFSHSRTKLGRDFRVLDSKGKADIAGVFFNKALITKERIDLRLTAGFDYKNIKNYLLNTMISRDNLRVFKCSFDLDISDRWGRNIFIAELDAGVPDIMGASKAKDPLASRSGAGAKFYKGVFNFFRLQPGPFSSSILWKNSGQFSNYNLVASEEFQIGGPTSVRGYPPAEFVGDKGWYTSLEWSFPPYFLSKKLKVPFTQEKFYDTLRFVIFYDWATAHFNRILPGEKKHRTLRGWGFGLRLNVKDNLSFRVEVGYPLGRTPSDNDHAHPWVECIWKF